VRALDAGDGTWWRVEVILRPRSATELGHLLVAEVARSLAEVAEAPHPSGARNER